MSAPPAEATPLDGLRVLDLSDPFGQYAGKLLANLGADVIKIEPPEGDAGRRIGPFLDDLPGPERSLFWWYYNADKRSLALDIAGDDGLDLFLQLAAEADIVLETAQPTADRPFDPLLLADACPRLIVLSLTPFGQDGPWADWAWSDAVALALGGPMGSCGYDNLEGAPPIRPTEHHAGHIAAYYAVFGAIAALYEREVSGLGQHIDASVHEACAFTIESSAPWALYERHPLLRQTGRHAGPQPTEPWQYPTADGRLINIFGMPRSEAAWLRLVQLIQRDGLGAELSDPQLLDGRNRQLGLKQETALRMLDQLAEFIAANAAEEIYHGAQQAGAAWSIIRTPDEAAEDPHWTERGFFIEVEHLEHGRTATYPGAPYILSRTPWRQQRRAPLLGEHTVELLKDELGLDPEQIAALAAAGIVA